MIIADNLFYFIHVVYTYIHRDNGSRLLLKKKEKQIHSICTTKLDH